MFGDEDQHIHCHSQRIDEIFLNETEEVLSNAEYQPYPISPFIAFFGNNNESESCNQFFGK